LQLPAFEPEVLARATFIAAQAWDRCSAWLQGLSPSERTLIREEDERMLRRRRWFDAHLRIHRVPLLVPDAVPDVTMPGGMPTIPAWVSYSVFDLGARIMHDSSGPLNLWWVVIETDGEENDLDLHQGDRRRVLISEDCSSVVLDVELSQPGTADPALAPFRFALDDPQSGIELMLAAVAGARLDFYRLRAAQEIRHLGSTTIQFPEDSLTPFLNRVDDAFARTEMEKSWISPFVSLASFEEQEKIMFTAIDNGKSEDILFDLELFNEKRDSEVDAVASARAALARAEFTRVSADADNLADETIQYRAKQAQKSYRILRQRLPRSLGKQVAGLVARVVTPGRPFVQFANMEGNLAGLVAIATDDDPRVEFVDLGHVTAAQLQEVSDLWLSLASNSAWWQTADVLDALLIWVGREIMNPINEVLQAAGTQHVVICPTRLLEQIPLHAAPLEDRTVADSYQVSYTPSAAVVSRLAAEPGRTTGLDVIVASSGAHAPAELGLTVLQGPGQEAQALHQIAPSARIIHDADATPKEALAAIAVSRVAHLAGHGRSHADELASGLWLTGSTPGSALMSAAQVHAGPLMRNTSLVILSACETARHPVGGPAIQAWRGLDSAFLSRGARAVVSSLWEISDLAALVYGIAFHVRLDEGAAITDAHMVATTALRTANVESRAADLLNWVRPQWRIEMEQFDPHRAYWWSAYRLSGACW
jgi:CHAT domain-containing protein